MSNIIEIAPYGSSASAKAVQTAGRWSHILVHLSKPVLDLHGKLLVTVTHQRSNGSESVVPGLELGVLADVADDFQLSAKAGGNLAGLIDYANGTPGTVKQPAGLVFAIPLGDRRLMETQTLTVNFGVQSALAGTYAAFLFDDGAKRAQGLPVQFVTAKTGALGRASKVYVFRDTYGAGATTYSDLLDATDLTVKATMTVDGEGSHLVPGGALRTLAAMMNTAQIPQRAVPIYSAPTIQPMVSGAFTGSDAANWSFLSLVIPEVPTHEIAAEGAARAEHIVAATAAVPAERRRALEHMGAAAPLAAVKEQAAKFQSKLDELRPHRG